MKKKKTASKKPFLWLGSWILALLSGFSTLFVTGCFLMYLPAPAYMAPDALTVEGVVKDSVTDTEIANIRVRLLDNNFQPVTQVRSDGSALQNFSIYEIGVPVGTYHIIADDTDGTNNNGAYSPATNTFNVSGSYYYTNISIFLIKTN